MGKLLLFIKEKQTRQDERNKIQVEQNEADNEAIKKTKQIIKANSALSDNAVIIKLSKYKRK